MGMGFAPTWLRQVSPPCFTKPLQPLRLLSIIIDGQTLAWPFSVFTPKQVFGPRNVKSQPIWIKFCIRLLLYGIHLRADLDRDRRVGGFRPNQNDYVFFVISLLVMHPKS